jgi:hypothetical protein
MVGGLFGINSCNFKGGKLPKKVFVISYAIDCIDKYRANLAFVEKYLEFAIACLNKVYLRLLCIVELYIKSHKNNIRLLNDCS